MKQFDCIIVGAGAAGLFCAGELVRAGMSVALVEHNERVGKKILISGGGRCNFTNKGAGPSNFFSENSHFMKSALSQFTAQDFISRVEKIKLPFYEKKKGQLFCKTSSKEIVNFLTHPLASKNFSLFVGAKNSRVIKTPEGFELEASNAKLASKFLVVATGGLSFESLGASNWGYEFAKQFGLKLTKLTPGLVPLKGSKKYIEKYGPLSGISFPAKVQAGKVIFEDDILLTHWGLSGPAILQISSVCSQGEKIKISIRPDVNWKKELEEVSKSKLELKNFLSRFLSDRFVEVWLKEKNIKSVPMNQLNPKQGASLIDSLNNWEFEVAGTMGYEKAEVTLGGISTDELSSKTMEAKKIPGCYFIGEVVDVTGWLGGYNFQWAWSSAFAAAQAIQKNL